VTRLSMLAQWRDAVRDSELDRTAKLVAHTLGTYADRDGVAFPSEQTIAEGASLGSRNSVRKSVNALEQAGFVIVRRSPGRRSHQYELRLPTAHGVSGSEEATAHGVSGQLLTSDGSTVHFTRSTPLVGESSRKRRARAAVEPNEPCDGAVIDGELYECGERPATFDPATGRSYCVGCRRAMQEAAAA
jgi:Helix-turn-helix domain